MATKTALLPASCLVVLLVLGCVYDVHAASCNIYSLADCLPYAKSYGVPNKNCCNAIKSLGAGASGATCLCNLMTSQTAKQYGVNMQAAIGMPSRCKLPVPYHSTCAGMKVPGAGW